MTLWSLKLSNIAIMPLKIENHYSKHSLGQWESQKFKKNGPTNAGK